MSHKLCIAIPSTFGESTLADNAIVASVKDFVSSEFNRCFGGSTAIVGNGQWNNDDGVTVSEPIAIVFALTDIQLLELQLFARDIAKYVKAELQQTCVLVWVEPVTWYELV